MKRETKTAELVFSEVLLEKLTSPGPLLNSLPDYPAEHIFFAVVSIAYDRWLVANRLEDTQILFRAFFFRIERDKEKALALIDTQKALGSSGETAH